MTDTATWYELKPRLDGAAPGNVWQNEEHNELSIGPHTRLAGLQGGAIIRSRELAEAFRTALIPVFQRRYPDGIDIEVVPCTGPWTKRLEKAANRDEAIIQARLATDNFSPNKKVVGL